MESPLSPEMFTFFELILFLVYIDFGETRWPNGWRAGLRIESSGFEPWPGHWVVFLGKTLYSHGASLHPGV